MFGIAGVASAISPWELLGMRAGATAVSACEMSQRCRGQGWGRGNRCVGLDDVRVGAGTVAVSPEAMFSHRWGPPLANDQRPPHSFP